MDGKVELVFSKDGATIRSPAIGSGEVKLTPSEVRSVITAMTAACEKFFPPLDAEPSGKIEPVIPDPRWYVQVDRTETFVLLRIQDPRFGWLMYSLPTDSALQASTYIEQAATGILGRPKPTPM